MEIIGLGYVGFESPDLAGWRTFGPEVMGFGAAPSPAADPRSVYLRMDDRRHRIAIHPGPVDKIAYIGWEIAGRRAYEDAVEKLAAEGIQIEAGDAALCELRGVRALTRFRDPVGYVHEIFHAQRTDLRSFRPGRNHAGFAADDLGVGHVVLAAPEFTDELEHFLFEVLGFEWFGGGTGVANRMGFYRPPLNARSHCIGYVQTPGHIGIHHMGIAVRELDDVGVAYDIVLERELPLYRTLGRHTQDPVISFYVTTPSGFPIEYLYEVGHWNETTETSEDRLSLWGHKLMGPAMSSTVRPVEPA